MESVQVFVQLSRVRCDSRWDSRRILPKLVIPTGALRERVTIRTFRASGLPVTRADHDTNHLLAFKRGLSNFLPSGLLRFGSLASSATVPSLGMESFDFHCSVPQATVDEPSEYESDENQRPRIPQPENDRQDDPRTRSNE